ncbi:MAG: phage integrase N-terminal SAM-like domain-containing protein, partial [Sphingomonas sp.]
MITSASDIPASSLRQRMIEDMNLRRFARKTQFDYVRHVAHFANYLGRPPDTATPEDLRLFQVEQRDAGLGAPTMNSIVSALRFFFTHTIDRPDLSRKLHTVKNPRSLPIVLSPDEVAQLLGATTCLKHKAAQTRGMFDRLRLRVLAPETQPPEPEVRPAVARDRIIARHARAVQAIFEM